MDAAQRILDAVRGLGADDLVLCLISGGGSALMALPAPGLTLADKQAVNRALLESRRDHRRDELRAQAPLGHQGRPAGRGCAPARVVTLAISDVPGDDPAVIALRPDRRPTPPPSPRRAPSWRDTASSLRRRWRDALAGRADETPKPGDPRLAARRFRLIATPKMALEAAAQAARAAGRDAAASSATRWRARRARWARSWPASRACRGKHCRRARGAAGVLLSGGETTVTVRGQGRGGRNTEFLLALALALDGHARHLRDRRRHRRHRRHRGHRRRHLRPRHAVARARGQARPRGDARRQRRHGVFDALGDLVVTGPTLTNVNDFRAILMPRHQAS